MKAISISVVCRRCCWNCYWDVCVWSYTVSHSPDGDQQLPVCDVLPCVTVLPCHAAAQIDYDYTLLMESGLHQQPVIIMC